MANKVETIIDTGPLVALLRRGEASFGWVAKQFRLLAPPFATCEAVLTETYFLLASEWNGPKQLFSLLESGLLVVDFSIAEEHRALAALMHKYRDLPMSLADACLVRMAELHSGARVLTLDAHFHRYRKNGRQAVPLIAP